MSTHRSSQTDRRAPSRKLRRRERIQLSTQRVTPRERPQLPRLGPELTNNDTTGDSPVRSRAASASRPGLWVGGILTRVVEQREHPFWATWLDAVSRLLPRRSPFGWRERDWRGSAWGRRAHVMPLVGALLVALIVAGTFAITIATHAAGAAQNNLHLLDIQSASVPPGNMLRPVPPAATATPAAPQYLIGAWASGSMSGGSVKVFVRVSHGDAPVAHVPVTLSVNFPGYTTSFGPAKTDADGVATITVTYGGLPPDRPVFVTASATIGRQTVTAETTFVTQ